MAAWICVIVCIAFTDFFFAAQLKKHSILTANLVAASNDCQLPSEERRRAEHNIPDCVDDWRCYKLDRFVQNTCEFPISARQKHFFAANPRGEGRVRS